MRVSVRACVCVCEMRAKNSCGPQANGYVRWGAKIPLLAVVLGCGETQLEEGLWFGCVGDHVRGLYAV